MLKISFVQMEIVDSSVVFQSVDKFISEKPGSEFSALNGVVNFLESREDEGAGSIVTYFLNSVSIK